MPEENQSAALDQLLEGFPTPSLISGRVEETPDGAWIRYEFKPSDDVDYVRALSQGDIASGVLAAMSRARGWPEIRGKSFTRHCPMAAAGSRARARWAGSTPMCGKRPSTKSSRS